MCLGVLKCFEYRTWLRATSPVRTSPRKNGVVDAESGGGDRDVRIADFKQKTGADIHGADSSTQAGYSLKEPIVSSLHVKQAADLSTNKISVSHVALNPTSHAEQCDKIINGVVVLNDDSAVNLMAKDSRRNAERLCMTPIPCNVHKILIWTLMST
ncbi:hypothetical protein ACOSQ3_002101 [Xanthoceras sorbifolium]